MTVRLLHRFVLLSLLSITGSQIAMADLLGEGHNAFLNYDFGTASELYAKYAQSLKKNPDPEGEALLEKFERELEIAENSLDNVQKIEVIDRIDLPAGDFVKAIKLPTGSGKLVSKKDMLPQGVKNNSDFVFSTEKGDFIMWSQANSEGLSELMQSELLLDGNWETPQSVGSILNEDGNARNPFLLADGVTLYFAGDGEGSMGGYDLFVATRDPLTGEFRQPVGVGFPFNSPYNEYALAIDEQNGIGWWVTDRNRLEGKVSVYVFKTNDVRTNYRLDDEEEIIDFARLEDISITQNPETDYKSLIKDIDRRFTETSKEKTTDFIFPMEGGRTARRLSDFSSGTARRNMEQYLSAQEEFNTLGDRLSELRKKYHETDRKKGSSTALKNQITELETKLEWQRERLAKMRNTIIAAELHH